MHGPWQHADNHTCILPIIIKLLLYKVIVQSTLLYGCETWAVTDRDVHRLEVFQMKCLRRMRGVTLLDRISNDLC